MTKEELLKEYTKCLLSPWYFAEKYCSVFDKTQNNGVGKIIPYECFPKQVELLKHYKSNRFSIVLKPRQAGVSTTTALFCAHLLLFASKNNPQKILIVANKQKTAQEFMNKIKGFIESRPEWLGLDYGETKNMTEFILTNGSGAKAQATSEDALRGYTPTLLIMDEAAFIEKGEGLWTSASASLSTGGSAILISTPNGLDSLYYETYQGAIDGTNDFKVFSMAWYEDPRYNTDLRWVKTVITDEEDGSTKEDIIETWDKEEYELLIKQGYLPTSGWFEQMCRSYKGDTRKISSELQINFLGSGDNVIPEEYIVHQETTNVQLPKRTAGFDNKIWIWEEPVEGHQYLLGADISRGDSADFSTMVVFDVDTGHQVMEYQGKVAPDVMGEIINEWGLKYDALVVVDVTGGMGQATIIKLMDLKYPNIYYSDPKNNKIVKERMYKYRKQGELIPGFIISTNRTLVVEALGLAIRDGAVAIRSSRFISELKTFIYIKGRPDHAPNKHDDILMGAAMALFVLQHSFKDLKRFKAQTVAMLNAWTGSATPAPNSTQNQRINDINDYSWLFQ